MLYLARQNGISPGSLADYCASKRISRWIYFGDDANWRIQAESAITDKIPRISVAQHLDKAANRLRDPYIAWVGELSRENQSAVWWASEIAAKNPYHMLFSRVCLLDAAYQVLGDGCGDDVLIIGGTPALIWEIAAFLDKRDIPHTDYPQVSRPTTAGFRQGLQKTAQAVASALPPVHRLGRISPLYQKFLDKHIVYRQKILRKHATPNAEPLNGGKTALFFSWIDRRSFSQDGSYTDPNFGPLPDIYRRQGYRVAFVPRILHTIPYEEAVIRLKKTGETLFFPEQYITHADFRRFEKESRSFSPVLKPHEEIGGIPIQELAAEHIEMTRSIIPENLLYHTFIQNLILNGTEPRVILHTCEGHSWENSLCLAVKTNMKDTTLLGYDNVTFSRFVLSMYPARNEMEFKPLPDYIITNGPLFKNTLVREGHDPHRIRCGCALRHTYLWRGQDTTSDSKIKHEGPRVKILVATAIGLGDSVELIAKASRAFGSVAPYEVIIKCHPMVNIDEARAYLGHHLNHTNISFSTASISDLLADMDILLYTYTSVCYEAMMYGVYPVCVQPENFINLDKLDATPDIRALAITPEGLRATADRIMRCQPEERREWAVKARRIVREALAPVNDDCIGAFFP